MSFHSPLPVHKMEAGNIFLPFVSRVYRRDESINYASSLKHGAAENGVFLSACLSVVLRVRPGRAMRFIPLFSMAEAGGARLEVRRGLPAPGFSGTAQPPVAARVCWYPRRSAGRV